MPRPRWSHQLTKGFTAIRKSLSLVTKGIEDQVVNGKPVGRVNSIQLIIRVNGLKEFKFKKRWLMVGVSSLVITKLLNIFGIKEYNLKYNYRLEAIVLHSLKSITEIIGTKQFKNRLDQDIKGIKQFNLNLDRDIFGIRQSEIHKEMEVAGVKQINLLEKRTIKAKKDITPILTAIGLFGENYD
jgi:hypothetical protein